MIDVGRICVKNTGREAGKRCVIIDIVDKNYVMVTGPQDVTGVRRRRVNMSHLEPLPEKLDIRRNASDEDVKAALESEHTQ